jgi:tetratricopeptide (TPR) repeat protein
MVARPLRPAPLLPALLLVLPLASAGAAEAQQLELKRDVPYVAWTGCPIASPSSSNGGNPDEAARLAGEATRAALLGNEEEAHRSLLRAAVLDPSSAELAYRLAMSSEQLGRPREALAEYCRFLALDSDSRDAAEVRSRLPLLIESMGPAVSAAAADAYRRGIVHFDAGRYADADIAFTQALRSQPGWSDGHYNRALARFAGGRSAAALDDLREYLELSPGALDFRQVLDVVIAYGGRPSRGATPGLAFASGLVVPGLGHFATGRSGRGALIFGSAAGVLAAALSVERVRIVCRSPLDEGVCPAEDVLEQRTERPYVGAGILGAAAIGILGAFDAYRGARVREPAAASAGDARARRGARLLPPAPGAGHEGVQLEVLRIRF